jgi:hypothetical protein
MWSTFDDAGKVIGAKLIKAVVVCPGRHADRQRYQYHVQVQEQQRWTRKS